MALSWTTVALPAIRGWNDGAFNGSLVVLVSLNDGTAWKAAVSANDGTTWAEYTMPTLTHFWCAICWNGTKFVALGLDNTKYASTTSTDGQTWTTKVDTGVTGNEDVYIASSPSGVLFFCTKGTTGGNQILTSSDNGATWISRKTLTNDSRAGQWSAHNGTIGLVALADYTYTSTDMVTWTEHGSLANFPVGPAKLRSLTALGSRFVGVVSDGKVITSVDGVNWALETTLSSSDYYASAAIADGMVMAISEVDGVCKTSTDGITWAGNTALTGGPSNCWSLVATARRFIAPIYGDDVVFVSSLIDYTYDALTDTLNAADTLTASQTTTIRDTVQLAQTNNLYLQVMASLTDSVALADALRSAYTALLTDSLNVATTHTGSAQALVSLAESLVLSGAVSNTMQAYALMASVVAFGDVMSPAYLAQLNDSADFTTAASSVLLAIMAITDSVSVASTVTGYLQFSLTLSDAVDISDTTTAHAALLALLNDGMVLTAGMFLAGEKYAVWIMSPDNEAIYQYEGFNFNSFTKFDGHYYGSNDQGLYLLEGSDDAGEPIAARVRTGLMDFSTGRYKQMARAYLGYTSDGPLLLKVVTVKDREPGRGEKVEDWYELTQVHTEMSAGRIPVGEGLKSVYWQFVLHNKAGADFATDEVRLYPLYSDRRIK